MGQCLGGDQAEESEAHCGARSTQEFLGDLQDSGSGV